MARETDDVALAARLDRIKKLTDQLVKTQADSAEARKLAERIKREADQTRKSLKPPRYGGDDSD